MMVAGVATLCSSFPHDAEKCTLKQVKHILMAYNAKVNRRYQWRPMNAGRMAVIFILTVVCASGCDSAPSVTPALPAASVLPAGTPTLAAAVAASPAVTQSAPAATVAPTRLATPSTAAPTPGPTSLFRTPTPPANPGTLIKDDGTSLVLSHPGFFWTLKLPRDWIISYDRGFELFANNPQQTAFMRVFSQVWPTQQEWLPNARAYVDYWKQYPDGNLFPVFAAGTQLAESEMSPDKYGGPYLRYEFDDAKRGRRYLQVYASGGGPNSVVLTVWSKTADHEATQAVLEGILSSLALLKLP